MKSIALICAFAAAYVCRAQTTVTITAHPESPAIAIPRDFMGLSFETGSLTSATGFPAQNVVFQRMVAQVGPGLLRFGGNSVDQLTGWMRGQRTSSTSSSVLTSGDADRVFAFALGPRPRRHWRFACKMARPRKPLCPPSIAAAERAPLCLSWSTANRPCT